MNQAYIDTFIQINFNYFDIIILMVITILAIFLIVFFLKKHVKQPETLNAKLFNNVGYAIMTYDFVNNEVNYSKNLKEVFGFDTNVDDIMETWRKRIHPDDKKITTDTLQKHIQYGPDRFKMIYRIYIKSTQQYRWLENYVNITKRNEEGVGVKFSAVSINVTEYQEKTQEIKSERERLQKTLDSSPVAMAIVAPNFEKIIYANEEFTSLLGLQSDHDLTDLFPNREDYEIIKKKSDQNQIFDNYQTRLLNAKGEILNVLLSLTNNTLDEFRILWVIDLSSLIEARKRAFQLKSTSEQIVQKTPIAIVVFDLKTGERLEFNEAFLNLVGIDLINTNTLSQLLLEDRVLKDIVTIYKRYGLVSEYQFEFKKISSGEEVWVDLTMQPIEYDGKDAVIACLVDVTSTRILLKNLEQISFQAQAVAKEKGHFLARMSHEIRTPLNAIMGLTHLTLKTELNDRQRNNIEKVHLSSITLLEIINDILDFSKIEAGKVELNYQEFNLEYLLKKLSDLLTQKAHEKGLEVVFDLPPDFNYYLIGDQLRISQILINLTSNAIKFTDKGAVVIRAEVLEINNSQAEVVFTVEDTGIGISEKSINKLFDPFIQADSTISTKYGGTGLGLTITKNLVKLMNGDISVDSEPGKGSKFEVKLRLFIGKKVKLEPSQSFENVKVMVCDDNDLARKIIVRMLESFGLTNIEGVKNGEEAIRLLRSDNFQLLFMDYRMPDEDGLSVTNRILKDKTIPNLPTVIMVTAFNEEVVWNKAKELGIKDILLKPVPASAMLDSIQRALSNEAALSSEEMLVKVPSDKEWVDMFSDRKILLVEDNKLNQEVAIELLKVVGVTIDIAGSGKIAIEKVEEKQYDLVLMDIQMPEMDGFQATRRIRKLYSKSKLPIVAMTADVVDGIKEKCLKAGMNDYLSKPIDPEKLYTTIAKFSPAVNNIKTTMPGNKKPVLLDKIKGVDVMSGLKKFNNRPFTYVKLLGQFYDSNKNFSKELKDSYETNDLEKVKRMIHTLKGTSGMFFMNELHDYLVKFEMKLKHEDFSLDKEVENLNNILDPQLKAIKEFVDKFKKVKEVTSVSKINLKQTLLSLKELMTHYDSEAVDLIEKIETYKRFAQMPNSDELVELVKQYDFDEASELIDEMIGTIK